MIDREKICALVPFRKGSKSLPHKNIEPLMGLPLFTYAVRFASHLGLQCVMTTDYDKQALGPYGDDAHLLARPEALASDEALIKSVICHALESTLCAGYDYCLLLQPTSPIRSTKIFAQLEARYLKAPEKAMALTVRQQSTRALKTGMIQDGRLMNLTGDNDRFFQNRQAFPALYSPDGNMYLFKIEEFLAAKDFPHENLLSVINEPEASIDIDEPKDRQSASAQIEALASRAGFEWLRS